MTHFREFVNNQKDCIVHISVFDTFWEPSNKVYKENVSCFCGDKERLKLLWLLPTDHSSSLTNQAESKMLVHLFVHIGPKVLVAEYITRFLCSQVTSKGVIMVFVQDFYPRRFNLRYVQYGSFVEKFFALRLVAEVNIQIRI